MEGVERRCCVQCLTNETYQYRITTTASCLQPSRQGRPSMADTLSALSDLDDFTIEVPSWAYGNSGTRFKVFTTPDTPRDPWEKIADAAQVNALTGLAPKVSIHIPWDKVEDYAALQAHAKELGVSIGSVNSNLFQDDDYRLGSSTNKDPKIRAKAVAHHLECLDVMRATGSYDLKIWL